MASRGELSISDCIVQYHAVTTIDIFYKNNNKGDLKITGIILIAINWIKLWLSHV